MIRLEQLRLDARLDRKALAKASGVSYGTIRRLEEVPGAGARVESLVSLADVLNARPSELLQPAVFPSAGEAA